MGQIRKTRAAINQAEVTSDGSALVFFEAVALGILVGFSEAGPLWGLGVGIGLLLLQMVPYIRILVGLIFVVLWGGGTYLLLPEFFDVGDELVLVAAIVMALIRFGAMLAAKDYFDDLEASDDKHIEKDTKTAETQEEDTKECPVCAERIKARAKKCRFCGHDLSLT